MPIYEYQCQSCQHQLEVLQKVSDSPLTDCPECGKAALRKKVSAAAFRLKGGGWYETDFKTGGKKNLAGESSGEGGGKAADSKTADSKTAEGKADGKKNAGSGAAGSSDKSGKSSSTPAG